MSVPLSIKIFHDRKEHVIFFSLVLNRFFHFLEIGPGIIILLVPSEYHHHHHHLLGVGIAHSFKSTNIYIYIYTHTRMYMFKILVQPQFIPDSIAKLFHKSRPIQTINVPSKVYNFLLIAWHLVNFNSKLIHKRKHSHISFVTIH